MLSFEYVVVAHVCYCLFLCFKSIFERILLFLIIYCFKLIFFMFSDYFDMPMLKIIFLNKKILF
jgi:hypothetical protein